MLEFEVTQDLESVLEAEIETVVLLLFMLRFLRFVSQKCFNENIKEGYFSYILGS